MSEQLSFSYYGQTQVITAPNICPLCNKAIVIREIVAVLAKKGKAELVFRCPSEDCDSFFIGYYRKEPKFMLITDYRPFNTEAPKFADIIKIISQSFVNIYCEADIAKQNGLIQIAGAGFRKAFEFLIKDYAKTKVPVEKYGEIEKLFSGVVVDNYIKDERIKNVAKRALWQGNDEAHYLRKWQDNDINDLIVLINLTIHWMEIEKLSDEYISKMPN